MALTQVTSIGLKDGEIVDADLHSAAAIALSKLADTGALGSAITATTQSASDDSTKLATTAFVQAAVTSLIDGAPGSLNTLNELAAAINDDSSYATTLTTALATKLPLAGGTLTGSLGIGASPTEKLHVIGQVGGTNPTAGSKWDIARFVAHDYSPTNSGGLTIGAYWNNSTVSGRTSYIQSSQSTDSGSTARHLLLNPDGGNVGIGGSPDELLHVVGTLKCNNIKILTANSFESSANVFEGKGTNGARLRSALSAETVPSFSNSDDTDTGMFLPGSDVLGLTTGGSERFRITADGSVGINTDVNGNGGLVQIRNNHAYQSGTTNLLTSASKAALRIRTSSDSSKSLYIGGIDETAIPYLQVGNLHTASGGATAAYDLVLSPYGGDVGIGTVPSVAHSSGSQLVIGTGSGERGMTIYSGSTSGGVINFAKGTSSTDRYDGRIYYTHHASASHMRFMVGNGGERMKIEEGGDVRITDGNLVVASGHGINFHDYGSGTDINSNLLNDYEEGVFSPTPNGSGQTYNWRRGRYTKIGNTVFFWFDVKWSGMSSGMTDGRINGLPFTGIASYLHAGYGAVSFRAMNGLESDMRIYGNSSYIGGDYIQLQHFNSSGTEVLTDFLASGRVTGEGFYFVNGAY